MNAIRRFLVFLVLGSCAFILSKAFLDLLLVPGAPPEGNATTRLILATSYFGVGILLVPYYQETLFVIRRNWYLVALVFLAAISSLWAETPGLVLQRSIAVLGTTLLGIAFAVRLSVEEQLRLMSWVFRIMAVLSVIWILMFPSGISDLGEWKGIFGYKNVLGSIMAMSVLVEWHLPANTNLSRFLKWLALFVSMVLLVFSASITPLVALVGSMFLVEVHKFANQRLRIPLYAMILAILLIVASGITALNMNAERLAGALGRTSNLTGRTEIWSLVLSSISERPVFGYGYSAFWYGSSSESLTVDQAVGTPVMYSHNGFLEVLLNLGVAGFVFALAFISFGIKRSYHFTEWEPSRLSLWPLSFFLFFLLYNMGECTILAQDLQWALSVAVVASTDEALFVVEEEQREELAFVPVGETT